MKGGERDEETTQETPPEIDAQSTGEKLAAMVAAEAEAAEAETPEDEEEEAGEDNEGKMDARILEALGNYLQTVSEVIGDSMPVTPCAFCHGFGFNALEILPDSHSHRCENCGGHGRVYTGSLVPGNETKPCDECRGSGFKTELPQAVTPPAPEEPAPLAILSAEEVQRIADDARARAGVNAA